MRTRVNLFTAAPEASKAVLALEQYCQNSGIPKRLIHLIKLRASIINGCAYCVDMHVKEARRDGMSEQWINLVSTWQEAQVYSEAERAVLGWTDAALRAHFSEEDIAKIVVIIGTINVWNRIAVGTRMQHPVDADKEMERAPA